MTTLRLPLPCAFLILLLACPELGCSSSDEGGVCNFPDACDDRKDCTVEKCDAAGECLEPVPVADGTPCAGGLCESGACALSGSVLPCIEQGIRNAIAAGGGPYTFSCDGLTPVVTEAPIVIDNNVILDGGGNLLVDGNSEHRVFSVQEDVTAELSGFQVTAGDDAIEVAGGISNRGTLTLTDSTLFDNRSAALNNFGTATVRNCSVIDNPERGIVNEFGAVMELINSTVSGNLSESSRFFGNAGGIWTDGLLIATGSTITGNTAGANGGGIYTSGDTILINSTVSGNTAEGSGGGIFGDDSQDSLTLINSTVAGNSSPEGSALWSDGSIPPTLSNSIMEGDCGGQSGITSNGYNIESPADTCSLNLPTDLVDVGTGALNLAPLADNGGPTETRALRPGSVAIDVIPGAACIDSDGELPTTDQRGRPRPEPGGSMCDVGAFELQP